MKIEGVFPMLAGLLLLFSAGAAEEISFESEIRNWETGLTEIMEEEDSAGEKTETVIPGGDTLSEYSFGIIEKNSENSRIYLMNDSAVDYEDRYVGLNLEDRLSGSSTNGITFASAPDSGNGVSWTIWQNGTALGTESFHYLSQEQKLLRTVCTLDKQKNITGILIEKQTAAPEAWNELLKTAEAFYYSGLSGKDALLQDEVCLQGKTVLGKPVNDLIALLGEPAAVQTLPGGSGRLLIYSTVVVSLRFDEETGQEIVQEMAVFGPEYSGPRAIRAGCTSEEFRQAFSVQGMSQEAWNCEMENDREVFSCLFRNNELMCWRIRLKEGAC